MSINAYTKNVIIQRQTPRLDNPNAIQNAGGFAYGVSALAAAGADYSKKEHEAKQKIKLNDSVINYKKSMIDLDAQMREENMDNPEGYADMFAKKSEEMAREFEKAFSDSKTKQVFSMTRKEIDLGLYQDNLQWQKQRNVSIMGKSLENARSDLQVMAARGGDLDGLLNDMRASTVAAQGIISNDKLDSYFKSGASGIVAARIDSLIDQGRTGEAKQILDNPEYGDYLGGDGLNKGYKAISQKNKQMSAEFKAEQTTKFRQEYKNFEDAMSYGIEPDPEVIALMKDRATFLGLPDVVEDIDLQVNTVNAVSSFVRDLSIGEQRQRLMQLQEDIASNPSSENLAEYKGILKAYENKEKQIKSGNGMQYYQQSGVIPPQDQIDVANPENIINSYQTRRTAQQTIYDTDGVIVPLFTKQEAASISDHYTGLSAGEKSTYLGSFIGGLNRDEASQLAGVVAGTDKNLAGVMALMSDIPVLAKEAILGADLEDKLTSRKDTYTFLVGEYGSAVGDPSALNSVTETIYNAYEYRLTQEGKRAGDSGILRDIAEEALGETISFGNSNVLPFRKEDGAFVSRSEFTRLIGTVRAEDIEQSQGNIPYINGEPVDTETLRDAFSNWEVVTIGEGLYHVRNGNDVLVDKEGYPFEFNLGMLSKNVDMTNKVVSRAKSMFGRASDAARGLIRVLPESDK